jgi:hypothetical protein
MVMVVASVVVAVVAVAVAVAVASRTTIAPHQWPRPGCTRSSPVSASPSST